VVSSTHRSFCLAPVVIDSFTCPMELFARGFQGHVILDEGDDYSESIVVGERNGNPITRRWVNEDEVEVRDVGLTAMMEEEFSDVVVHSDL